MQVLSPIPHKDSGDSFCPADRKPMILFLRRLVEWVGYKYWLDTGLSKGVWFRGVGLFDDSGGENRDLVSGSAKGYLEQQLATLQLEMGEFLKQRAAIEDDPDAECPPDSELERIIREASTIRERVRSYLSELGSAASDLKQGTRELALQYRKVLNLPPDCQVFEDDEEPLQ
jgi:hypothetical protein